MARNKTAAELRAEVSFLRILRFTEGLASILNNLIRVGGLVWISYFIYQTVAVLAGTTTTADIGIRFLGEVKISNALAWMFGAGGVAYGWSQRELRKKTVERLQGRNQQLEMQIDPNRSSSRLTLRGDTRPEDKR